MRGIQLAIAGLKLEGDTGEESEWPPGVQSDSQTTASNWIENSVLLTERTGFYQQPEWTRKQILIQSLQLGKNLDPSLWDPKQKT